MSKVFFDTETCGLHGMAVLIQYAFDDGPITLFSPWTNPISETLRLIESFCEQDGVIGFNLVFDWFHLCKLYTTFSMYSDYEAYPIDIIDELAEIEEKARDGPCVKPKSALDLMLHARKGPYQSVMNRSPIRIKRIPTVLADKLALELEKRIPLSDIYFAKRKDKTAEKWKVYDIKDAEGEIIPDFKDIVLSFKPSSALKALAVDALKLPVTEFKDIMVDEAFMPVELGYAPFAKAIGSRGNWKGAWPQVIRQHISHWAYNSHARQYASDDVRFTRDLYNHFDCPELGDDDSVLACMIGAVRWKGFAIDLEGLKKLKQKALEGRYRDVNGEKVLIPTAPRYSRIYLEQVMDETEKLGASASKQKSIENLHTSTKKTILEEIRDEWKKECPSCDSKESDCKTCSGTGLVEHPAAIRAREVLNARQAQYEADFYDKLILAGRFHASFAVIGALSSRMGGGGSAKGIEGGGYASGDGLNAQGVKKDKSVRNKFPLAFEEYQLSGGDFSGFEVTLAEACYNDANLRKQLLTCEKCSGGMEFSLEKNDFLCLTCGSNKGKKIHALFGVHVYPEHTYESLKATDGTKNDLYTRAKSAVFSMLYGGTEHTLQDRLGVPLETALSALARFHKEFPGVKKFQDRTARMFCTMEQRGGLGSAITWRDPSDYIESMLGFRRYFTLENQITKALFELAQKPPKEWTSLKITVQRRERMQSASGAVQSALYGAAFGLQASNKRAADNHTIQSTGAQITKKVERDIWDLQPNGVHKFRVIPMNVHDEIMCPTLPEYVDIVAQIVKDSVESYRKVIPLIRMDWVKKLNSWADKS